MLGRSDLDAVERSQEQADLNLGRVPSHPDEDVEVLPVVTEDNFAPTVSVKSLHPTESREREVTRTRGPRAAVDRRRLLV